MKKTPLLLSIALMVGMLATVAFSAPLTIRNGVVSSYTAGNTITIRAGHSEQTYMIRQDVMLLPQGAEKGITPGSRVTVVGQCFRLPKGNPNWQSNKDTREDNERWTKANDNPCYALAIILRADASGAGVNFTQPAATGAGSTGIGTATPMPGGTTPLATATPAVAATPTP